MYFAQNEMKYAEVWISYDYGADLCANVLLV